MYNIIHTNKTTMNGNVRNTVVCVFVVFHCSYLNENYKPYITESVLVEYRYTFLNIIQTTLITTSSETFTLHGKPTLIQGIYGKAIYLNGEQQYLTSSTKLDSCLSNLDKCTAGFTMSMWLNFDTIMENTYILTNGGNAHMTQGFSFYYKNGQLNFVVSTSTDVWELTLVQIPVEVRTWHYYQLSWGKNSGAEVYIDGKLVGTTKISSKTESHLAMSGELIYGFSKTMTTVYANMMIEEISEWRASIYVLKATEKISQTFCKSG